MSRVGITIAKSDRADRTTTVETALEESRILQKYVGKVALSTISEKTEEDIIRSLREVLA
jgi:hypothetical protein